MIAPSRPRSYGRLPSRSLSPQPSFSSPPSPLPSPGEIWLPECGLAKDGMWHCALTASMLIAWSGFEDYDSETRWYDVCTGTNSSACDPEALILRSRIRHKLEMLPTLRDDRQSEGLTPTPECSLGRPESLGEAPCLTSLHITRRLVRQSTARAAGRQHRRARPRYAPDMQDRRVCTKYLIA